MIDTTTLATFVVVVLGLFLVPGPAVLLVLTRTAQGGRRGPVHQGSCAKVNKFQEALARSGPGEPISRVGDSVTGRRRRRRVPPGNRGRTARRQMGEQSVDPRRRTTREHPLFLEARRSSGW